MEGKYAIRTILLSGRNLHQIFIFLRPMLAPCIIQADILV